MNRNVESHFSELPKIDIERSVFDRSSSHKTSFNVGDLIPFYVDEVLPGDTFRVKTSKVVRLQTMLTPIMDNMYLDTYYFFVPNRLVWSHWKEFCGENTNGAWVPTASYKVPVISSPSGGFNVGTVADYMGLPVGVSWSATDKNAPISLPIRGYNLIYNEFFRDENLIVPATVPMGDSNMNGSNTSPEYGGVPHKACKYHDRFTSCLPSAQKASAPVQFPLLSGTTAPVVPLATSFTPNGNQVVWKATDNTFPATKSDVHFNTSGGMHLGDTVTTEDGKAMVPVNLYADLSTSVGAVTVNDLRLAFQLQKFYERAARTGSRYIEYLKGMFGITAFDNVLQRPEYLGGNRVPLNIHEVTNSAQSTNDFLGDLGAKSATSDVHADFEKSFCEHGFVIGVMCVRYDHSYCQGLERFWTRKDLFSFYNPLFASLGEMPVYKYELYANGNMNNDQVFGYQEAWSEYRYKENRISGEMRPGIANTLASWHLGDYYSASPTLSSTWIKEEKSNVDRCLAVQSANANQVFCDIYIENICTRPMPTYSIPGLIDHH